MFTGARFAPASQAQPSHEAGAWVLHGMVKWRSDHQPSEWDMTLNMYDGVGKP
jgi:hypothetical protein